MNFDSANMALSTLTEGTSMYEFYKSRYKRCFIPFRVIEHLYENYKSVRDTFEELMRELNQDISI